MRRLDTLRCFLKVDLGLIRANLTKLKELAPGKKVLTTVKANAYGHGMYAVAEAVEDLSDMYAVASVDEGSALRERIGGDKPILILSPISPAANVNALKYQLTETVFDMRRAKALDEFSSGLSARTKEFPSSFKDHKAHIHIAVDTGMSRIGLRPDESGLKTVKDIMSLPHISVDGIFTHFAKADCKDLSPTRLSYERFLSFKRLLEREGIKIPCYHAANTAAVLAGIGTDSEMDMVRLGIGVYGLYPSLETDRARVKLSPALSWYSYLSMVKEIPPGTSVSYGYTFTADRDMRIGTVSAGYADGFPRVRSNKGFVLVRGVRCPIIGNICMDQFMVDLSKAPDASEGDIVTLLGSDGGETVTADEIALDAGTISYEIITGISGRVPRVYDEGES